MSISGGVTETFRRLGGDQPSRCALPREQDRHPRVSRNVALMSGLKSHFNGHRPIERDSQETDGVFGTQIVRRKTDENLGRSRSIINEWFFENPASRKRSAPKIKRDGPSSVRPVVSVSALLKLADWMVQRIAYQGGDRCKAQSSCSRPPQSPLPADHSQTALGSPSDGQTEAGAHNSQSDRSSTSGDTSGQEGGVA